MLTLLFGFLVGALAVLAAEAAALLAVLDWLRRKNGPGPSGVTSPGRDLDAEQSLAYAHNKKGIVWLLESDKIPRATSHESPSKVLKEQKTKKGIVEVSPTKKYGKIKDHSLILVDIDGSQEKTIIQLMDCMITAVSASDLSSRKWAKRYPIRVESKNSVIYKGNRTFYLFLETSWEKEAWCKALRLASCSGTEKLKWYGKLSEDFHRYLASLNAEYPSFMKPSETSEEAPDRTNRTDASSKVRFFLKKFAKKASKSGGEHKSTTNSSSYRGENRVSERLRATQDVSSSTGLTKTSLTEHSSSNSLQDLIQQTAPMFSQFGSESQASVSSDLASNERLGVDEGRICWNLLFSRLFFDAKRSMDLNRFIKERIQRSLSNMRTPSYIRGITCTSVDLGDLPPYIRCMRVLPMNLSEVWAFEMDIEYSGGILLDIETRLEVCEPDFQKGLVDSNLEPNTAGEVTSDLLEGFEHYGEQLKHSSNSTDNIKNRIGEDKPDGLKQLKNIGWASTYVSRWKSIVNSIAEQVSQVPLSLAIKIASLRGTLRLHIKPPPSDRLWFGFTSMPDIEWNVDSSVGEHKITSGHIALLSNRFKAAIQETLVLPNCENICIPWMLAEKDDWVPRNVAPFIWLRQEVADIPVDDTSNSQSGESKIKQDTSKGITASSGNILEDDTEKKRGVTYTHPTDTESVLEVAASRSAPVASTSTDQTTDHNLLEDLKKPLLRNDDIQDSCSSSGAVSPEKSSGTIVRGEQQATAFEDDARQKRMGRRARMLDLGKKMGEKLEEKRRNIEERGRHIVEKMRENTRN